MEFLLLFINYFKLSKKDDTLFINTLVVYFNSPAGLDPQVTITFKNLKIITQQINQSKCS